MPVRSLFGGLGLLIDANSSRIKGESEIDVEGFRKLFLRKGPILRPRVFTGCEIRLSGGFSVPFSPSSKYRISTINVSWLGRNTDSKQAQIFPGNVRLRLTRETRPHDLNRFSSNLFPEHSVPLLRDCFSNDSAIYFRIKEYHKTSQRGVQLTYRGR